MTPVRASVRHLVWILAAIAAPTFAQTPDSTARPIATALSDSTAAPDTSAVSTIGITIPDVTLPGMVARRASDGTEAPPDTARSGARALRRSLLVPGWGQATNGQTVKVPFVAAAVVGAATYFVIQQREYTRFRRSALFAGCQQSPDRDVCADVADAQDEWIATGSPGFAQASAVRNTARGRRDVAGLIIGVVYAFQALDAYIAAQLLDFDVSEDVAVRASAGGFALRIGL